MSPSALPADAGRPPSAQRGACGVSLMPRDEVVITAGGRFLVLTLADAADLHAALGDVLHAGRPT